jgi:hypothetical protein
MNISTYISGSEEYSSSSGSGNGKGKGNDGNNNRNGVGNVIGSKNVDYNTLTKNCTTTETTTDNDAANNSSSKDTSTKTQLLWPTSFLKKTTTSLLACMLYSIACQAVVRTVQLYLLYVSSRAASQPVKGRTKSSSLATGAVARE